MTTQVSIGTRAWAELLLLSAIWGASFLSIAIALRELPVMTLVAHRVFWAALLLWAYVLWRGLPIPKRPGIWAALFVMGLLNNALPFSLMAWGQVHIETGLTSIFNAATAPFGVLLAAMIFVDERLTPTRAVGIAVSFFGIVIVIGFDSLRSFDIRSTAQLAVLAGALSYAFASVWARKFLGVLPPQVAAMGMLTGSSFFLVIAALWVDGPPDFDLSINTWGAISYFSVLGTACAYLLYYRVLSMAGSGNLMLCTLLIVPFAIVLGAFVLGERLEPRALTGFAVLGLGLVILDGRIWKLLRR